MLFQIIMTNILGIFYFMDDICIKYNWKRIFCHNNFLRIYHAFSYNKKQCYNCVENKPYIYHVKYFTYITPEYDAQQIEKFKNLLIAQRNGDKNIPENNDKVVEKRVISDHPDPKMKKYLSTFYRYNKLHFCQEYYACEDCYAIDKKTVETYMDHYPKGFNVNFFGQ